MQEPLILPDSTEIKQRVLRREGVGAYRVISRYALDHARFELVEDEAHGLLVRLVSEVLRERFVSEVQTAELRVPATWWDHFKVDHGHRWFMRRFVRRFPVKWTVWSKRVYFDLYNTYPNADVNLPPGPLGRPIIYETTSQSDWSPS